MLDVIPTPSPWALLLAFGMDRLWGEVPAAVHPVVWMGRIISILTRHLRLSPAPVALLGGGCVALIVPVGFGFAAWGLMNLPVPFPIRVGIEALLLSTTFAVRALGEAVLSVRTALDRDGIAPGRIALRALCSRDPSELNPSQVSAAAIESAAENASDSFVAPLFYYALLGLPGAMAYRAINTLDAMLGYRGPLEHLGKASARLDDLVNLIPARLTAFLLLISDLQPRRALRALRVWWMDARVTESPNAGHPMAMIAGLLGVRLEKPGVYVLGARLAHPCAADISRAWRVVSRTSWIILALSVAGVAVLR